MTGTQPAQSWKETLPAEETHAGVCTRVLVCAGVDMFVRVKEQASSCGHCLCTHPHTRTLCFCHHLRGLGRRDPQAQGLPSQQAEAIVAMTLPGPSQLRAQRPASPTVSDFGAT